MQVHFRHVLLAFRVCASWIRDRCQDIQVLHLLCNEMSTLRVAQLGIQSGRIWKAFWYKWGNWNSLDVNNDFRNYDNFAPLLLNLFHWRVFLMDLLELWENSLLVFLVLSCHYRLFKRVFCYFWLINFTLWNFWSRFFDIILEPIFKRFCSSLIRLGTALCRLQPFLHWKLLRIISFCTRFGTHLIGRRIDWHRMFWTTFWAPSLVFIPSLFSLNHLHFLYVFWYFRDGIYRGKWPFFRIDEGLAEHFVLWIGWWQLIGYRGIWYCWVLDIAWNYGFLKVVYLDAWR